LILIKQRVRIAAFAFAMVASGRTTAAQLAASSIRSPSSQVPAPAPSPFTASELVPLELLDTSHLFVPAVPSYTNLSLTDLNIKFDPQNLMNILRDSRHESWVLAAYPDPQTSRPLIGAGFNLDVSATEHPQFDLFNPHVFIEPSSAQLWQAAGLSPAKLQLIHDQFDRDLRTWKKKNFRRKIRTHQLSPELTDQEAKRLLQVSVILAVQNARAYCRLFDQLNAFQQMALTQLVFQMGVNLEEFIQFLGVINDPSYRDPSQPGSNREREAEHWKAVQNTLIQSDWARRYTSRAVGVIAMFDPDYDEDPTNAEREVTAVLHPLVVHHGMKPHASSVRASGKRQSNSKTPL
jgi:hypothetical protein